MSNPSFTRSASLLLWVGLPIGLAIIAGLVLTGVGPLLGGVVVLSLCVLGVVGLMAAPPAHQWLPVVAPLFILALSFSAQGADDGVDIFEIAFGVGLLGFLVAWYGIALTAGTRTLRSSVDIATALFIVLGGFGGLALALVTASPRADIRSDLTCMLAFAMIFPIRELCVRHARGPQLVAGALIGIGLYAAAMNAFRLYGALTGAVEIYEVVDVRIASGEIHIVGSLLLTVLWLTSATTTRTRLVLFAIASFLLAGLLLTKSRGAWITAIAGLGAAGLLADWRIRRRLGLALAGGSAAVIVAGLLTIGPQLALIGIGVLRRFTSISTAATADISLLNRYAEAAATWTSILDSPVLGHGWGAPIIRHDLITGYTYTSGFVHNGYLWLWHKVGLWGLLLCAVTLLGTLWHGTRAARARWVPPTHRAFAAGAAGALVAYYILAIPSNPYVILDQMLVVSVTLGLASGLWIRARRELRQAPQPSAAP